MPMSSDQKHGRILLLQLPAPTMTPVHETANQPVAAASLRAATFVASIPDVSRIDLLSRSVMDCAGDALLIKTILEREPTVVGFTCYLWNVERSLFIAGELKRRCDALIVIGGPEVKPDNPWVLEDARWDVAFCGEGEGSWVSWLQTRDAHGTGTAKRGGSHRILPAGEPLWIDGLPALRRWTQFGDHDDLTAFVEVGRGCASSCIFCVYSSGKGRKRIIGDQTLIEELTWAQAKGINEVFLLDPGLNRRDNFMDFLNVLSRYDVSFSAELEGHLVDEAVAARLAVAGVSEVEIGLQSAIDSVRRRARCPGTAQRVLAGCRYLLDSGVGVRVDLLVGLPGDTEGGIIRSAQIVRELLPEAEVQLFPLLVLPGAPMRQRAQALGLSYQPLPPYTVTSTASMGQLQLLTAWQSAEDILAVRESWQWPDLGLGSGSEPVISRLRLDLTAITHRMHPEPLGDSVGSELGNAICVRFVGAEATSWPVEWIVRFLRSMLAHNPYVCVDIVLETGPLPTETTAAMLLQAVSQPWHCLNRRDLETDCRVGRLFYLTTYCDLRRLAEAAHVQTIVVISKPEAGFITDLAAKRKDVLLLVEGDAPRDWQCEDDSVRFEESWPVPIVGKTVRLPT